MPAQQQNGWSGAHVATVHAGTRMHLPQSTTRASNSGNAHMQMSSASGRQHDFPPSFQDIEVYWNYS